jgi:hypothetical protein
MFAKFFNDNKAFECLEVDEERDNNLCAIASLLQRFDTLKDFEVTNQNAWPGEPCRYILNVDSILEALTGHTGLRNLAIADAKIGEGGGNALAMILQNPTINLTSLTLNATEMYESGKPYRDGDYYYNRDINGYNESDEEEDADDETIEETEMEIDDDIVDDDNEMGAQAANILASGLRGNVTLKELEISHMELVPSR